MDWKALEAAAEAWAETLPTTGGAFPGWYEALAYQPGPTVASFIASTGTRDLCRAPNQIGKAQPIDEPVLTPSGWKPIGSLRPFDAVIAGDGTVTYVLGVYPQGRRPVYRLRFEDGASTRSCGEHLWRVKTPTDRWAHRERWSVMPLAEIVDRWGERPPPTRRVQIPAVGPVQTIAREPLLLDPYLLGVLLGDGYLAGASVMLASADADLVNAVAAAVPAGIEVARAGGTCDYILRTAATRDPATGRMQRSPLIDALRELGVWGRRSAEKQVPERYAWAGPAERLALLQGLMDTDGTVSASGSVSFTTVSPGLALQVADLVRGLGGKARTSSRIPTYSHKGQRKFGQVAYTLQIYLAAPLFRLGRKLARCRPLQRAADHTLRSALPDGEAECVCIAVAHPDHTYVTRDYIVTHNTRGGAARADRWSLSHPGKVLGVLVADLVNAYPEFCAKVHETITLPELDPATSYVEGKGYSLHGRHGLRYRNGTRWLFRTGSGPLQGLEVFSAHAGWIDEVPTPAHYSAFTRGVHGPIWVTFTPIGRDPRWFRIKVEGNPETGEPPEERWTQFVPALSVRECPWRTEAQIAEMIAKVDPIYRPQRVRGEWEGPTTDRRMTAFTDASIIDALPTDGGPWYASWGIDHGEGAGKEFAVLLLWNARYVVVIDEYVNPNATKPDADAQGILAVMARRDVPLAQIRHWRGDANSAGKGNVGETVNAMLGKALGVRLGWPGPVGIQAPRKGPGSVDTGEQIINVALDARELLVHRRCSRLIAALWHYQATGPADPDKHGIDALRYALVEVLTASGRPSTKLYSGGAGLQVLDHLPAPTGARPY